MNNKRKALKRQKGFTLVEMSVTMAAAGLLFAAVTTGQELVDQAKATKLLNDIKSVEARVQQHAQIKRRLPGDCDRDGIVDYAADGTSRLDNANATRAGLYAYKGLLATIPSDGADASAQTDACTLLGTGAATGVHNVTTNTTNANVWLNDLKVAGVVSDSAPNRTLAKMAHEDFAFLGHVTDNGAESALDADYNAIVVHNVPQWMARRVAMAINGQDARADRSRVRQLVRNSANGTYAVRWQAVESDSGAPDSASMRDSMVTIAYFFDRVPESKVVADAD